jgi:glycosyltransferase involved in cell wall biosynthesis
MRSPRHIALVIPTYVPALRYGGPILATHALAKALTRQGRFVTVLTSDSDGPGCLRVPSTMEVDGVHVRYLHRWRWEDFIPQVGIELARVSPRPAVVHVAPPFAACTLSALTATTLCDIPVVMSPRGSFMPWALEHKGLKKRLGLAVLRPFLARVAAFHATSEAEAASCRALGLTGEIAVVPNGVELPPLDPGLPSTTPPRILALGRIHPVKALDRLIRACAILRDRGTAFELTVVGQDATGYSAELQALAAQLRVEDRVRWSPPVDDRGKWAALARARVVALPSHSENFGNVVLEALASGRPVVASRSTPWEELETRSCGRWVPNDPASLAAALAPYLAQPTAADEDGTRGRALVIERYGWDNVVRRMIALYERAVVRHNERSTR